MTFVGILLMSIDASAEQKITRTRILRADQHEVRREGQAALRPADRDDFILERLSHDLVDVSTNGKNHIPSSSVER